MHSLEGVETARELNLRQKMRYAEYIINQRRYFF